MKITVQRTEKYPENDAQFGELSIDGVFECFTLERISKIIPNGIYSISFYFSPHNNLQVPLLIVPGREYIEIHPANYPSQLLGCIAVGTSHNQDSLSNSRFAFSQLMAKIQNQSDVSFEIVNTI